MTLENSIWQIVGTFAAVYLGAANLVAFFAYLIDKLIAVQNGKRPDSNQRMRIPEKKLMILAAVGGSAGALLGMLVARHKIRKPKFYVGVPALLVGHVAIITLFIYLTLR